MKTENSLRDTPETWQSPGSQDAQPTPIPEEEDELQGKAFQRHTQPRPPQSPGLLQLQHSAVKKTPLKERGSKKTFSEAPLQFCLIRLGKIFIPQKSRLGLWLEKKSLQLQGFDRETLVASNMEKLITRLRSGISQQQQHILRNCGVTHKVTDLIKKMGSVHLTPEDLKDLKACSSAFKGQLRNEEVIQYNEFLPVIEAFQNLKAAGEQQPERHPLFLGATRQLLAGKKEYHKGLILEICSLCQLIDQHHIPGKNLDSQTFAISAGTSLVKLDIETDSPVGALANLKRASEKTSIFQSVLMPFLEAVNLLEAETTHTPHQPYPDKKEPVKRPLPLPPKALTRKQQALKTPEPKQEPPTQVKSRVEDQVRATTPKEQKKAKQALPLPQKAMERKQESLQAKETKTVATRRAEAPATSPKKPPMPIPQEKRKTRPDIPPKPGHRHQ